MPETSKAVSLQSMIKNLKNVLGDSGTERYGGYFLEEFNVEWRDEKRVENVEKMRRTDSTVKAALTAVKAPLLSTEWRIEGGDDVIREYVEKSVFGMERSWKEWLREALAYLDFGHYCFEIIYEMRDGRITIADLAPRIPRSIQSWEITGKKFGITQFIRTDAELPDKSVKVGTFQLEIPADKLLILTNDKEGDDVTGQSILRSAYKSFKIKDVLYRIQGIAAERHGVGVPVLNLPDSAGAAEKSKAEEMLENLRSNEKAFILLPGKKEDWNLQILTPSGNPQGDAIDKAIEHHDRRILMSVLAGFLGLGSDSTGSFALSKDQSSFFLQVVEDKASYLAEQFDKQVIKRVVDIGFGQQKEYPHLRYNTLGNIDFKEMSEVLKSLTDGGYIKADNKMKKFTRSVFQLPEITDEESEEMELQAAENELNKIENDGEFDLPEEMPEIESPDENSDGAEEDDTGDGEKNRTQFLCQQKASRRQRRQRKKYLKP